MRQSPKHLRRRGGWSKSSRKASSSGRGSAQSEIAVSAVDSVADSNIFIGPALEELYQKQQVLFDELDVLREDVHKLRGHTKSPFDACRYIPACVAVGIYSLIVPFFCVVFRSALFIYSEGIGKVRFRSPWTPDSWQ